MHLQRALLGLLWAISLAVGAESDGTVELLPVERMREFPEATEPGAVQFACSDRRERLERFFAESGAKFDRRLVRR